MCINKYQKKTKNTYITVHDNITYFINVEEGEKEKRETEEREKRDTDEKKKMKKMKKKEGNRLRLLKETNAPRFLEVISIVPLIYLHYFAHLLRQEHQFFTSAKSTQKVMLIAEL